MSLIQAECERQGMTTVSISMLWEISRKMRAPRVLCVPYDLGHPFGRPEDPDLQHAVIERALALLERDDVPLQEEFREGQS